MTHCLLCPSPAVADGLCVPCGAKKWAADLRVNRPIVARMMSSWKPRADALREIATLESAHAFLDKLDAARKARGGQVCSRGCRHHEEG